jgi:hypothetical protein
MILSIYSAAITLDTKYIMDFVMASTHGQEAHSGLTDLQHEYTKLFHMELRCETIGKWCRMHYSGRSDVKDPKISSQ